MELSVSFARHHKFLHDLFCGVIISFFITWGCRRCIPAANSGDDVLPRQSIELGWALLFLTILLPANRLTDISTTCRPSVVLMKHVRHSLSYNFRDFHAWTHQDQKARDFFLYDFFSCSNLTLLWCWSDTDSEASVEIIQHQMDAEVRVCSFSGKYTPCIYDICYIKVLLLRPKHSFLENDFLVWYTVIPTT